VGGGGGQRDRERTEVDLAEGAAPDLAAELVLAADNPIHLLLVLSLSSPSIRAASAGRWKGNGDRLGFGLCCDEMGEARGKRRGAKRRDE
jgi:hypothetical protein